MTRLGRILGRRGHRAGDDHDTTPAAVPAGSGGEERSGALWEAPTASAAAEREAPAPARSLVSGPSGAAAEDPAAGSPDPAQEATPAIEPAEGQPGDEFAPGVRLRSRMRRRLRFLRRARELLLRDLGGFTYERARTSGADPVRHEQILEGKVARLRSMDAEIAALTGVLGDPARTLVIREPGIGGTCPSCRELHPSDARFCSRCGMRVDAPSTADAPSRPGVAPPGGAPAPGPSVSPQEPAIGAPSPGAEPSTAGAGRGSVPSDSRPLDRAAGAAHEGAVLDDEAPTREQAVVATDPGKRR